VDQAPAAQWSKFPLFLQREDIMNSEGEGRCISVSLVHNALQDMFDGVSEHRKADDHDHVGHRTLQQTVLRDSVVAVVHARHSQITRGLGLESGAGPQSALQLGLPLANVLLDFLRDKTKISCRLIATSCKHNLDPKQIKLSDLILYYIDLYLQGNQFCFSPNIFLISIP